MKAAAWADALDLKNAGAALFEPDLDHLSLEAILVLASGKFSAEIVDHFCIGAHRTHGAELTDENVAASNDQLFDFIRKMMFSIFVGTSISCCYIYIQFSARPPGTARALTFAGVECK
jgi:hypothetical protein